MGGARQQALPGHTWDLTTHWRISSRAPGHTSTAIGTSAASKPRCCSARPTSVSESGASRARAEAAEPGRPPALRMGFGRRWSAGSSRTRSFPTVNKDCPNPMDTVQRRAASSARTVRDLFTHISPSRRCEAARSTTCSQPQPFQPREIMVCFGRPQPDM